MKKLYIFFLLVFFLSELVLAQVVIEWQKCFGGTSSEYAEAVVQTFDGGYILAGSAHSNNGDVTFNYGDDDYWVVKVDVNGNLQWQKSYGGSEFERISSIKQTIDGGYILAGTSKSNDGDVSGNHVNQFGDYYDYWIVKIDGSGSLQWQKCFGGSAEDWANSIIQTADAGYIVIGSTNSNDGDVTNSHGQLDIWVLKLDSLGNLQWQKCYGGSAHDWGKSIIETQDGNFIIAGSTSSIDGDVTNLIGFVCAWILKIDNTGSIMWKETYGGSDWDDATSVVQTLDGGYILVGTSESTDLQGATNNGGEDFWVVKIDSIGALMWQRSLGGPDMEEAYSVIQTNDGGYIVAGFSSSSTGNLTGNFGEEDFWVVKLDALGVLEWEKNLGGSGQDWANCIIQNGNSDYVVAGFTTSTDVEVYGNNGYVDMLIFKLTPEFNLFTGKTFFDLNSNNIHDGTEPIIAHHKITENNTLRFALSNNIGLYNVSVIDTGSFSIYADALLHYSAQPNQYTINFSSMLQVDSLNHFAFQPNGIINDLKISISPLNAFRPGFDAHYNIYFKNIGTTNHSGTIIFYPDTNLNFVSSSITPATITADSIIWSTNALSPFDDGNIILTFNVNSATPNGTIITSNSKIEPFIVDADTTNNTATWDVTVTGSFDPNDILVNREIIFTNELPNPPFLEYLVRFQNTGTDTAFTVKIKNPLPLNSQINSFEFLEATHPVQLNYNNAEQVMWFHFDNILLPDSNVNEVLSHGYIRYKIKPLTTLVSGDLVENSAAIFFDFNAPVITNTAVTEIVLPISTPELKDNFNLSLFPNPTNSELNALFTLRGDATVELQVFNNLGQIVKTIPGKKMKAGNNKITFSTEKMPPGIYYLQLLLDGEAITRKLVKM